MKPQYEFLETLITILGVISIFWLILTIITI
jgi:hypothetical protein